jgi:drug/metabolite transporter (DMT)-like permease
LKSLLLDKLKIEIMSFTSKKPFSKILLLTGLALIAFAANSILCRLALGEKTIDATSFTIVRLLSGTIVLMLILQILNSGKKSRSTGSWPAATMLFLYAAAFSFAYITLDTGTGALILFAAVQLTMIIFAVVKGDRLGLIAWVGVLIAFIGFVYLVLPGVSTPSFLGFILMTIAGVAWGFYSLIGRDSVNPLADTAFNFTRTLPFILVMTIITFPSLELSTKGFILALLSGAIASGIGYTIWYTALKDISATQAAVVQLTVPIFAAIGGVVFMSEVVTLRLIVAAVIILSGVVLVLKKNSHSVPSFNNEL